MIPSILKTACFKSMDYQVKKLFWFPISKLYLTRWFEMFVLFRKRETRPGEIRYRKNNLLLVIECNYPAM